MDNVTGVIQPYKEYVDKWNMGVPENLVEVQEGDGHISQVMGTIKNTFSGVEDMSEFEAVDVESVDPVLDKTPSTTPQQESDRPIRTQKPVLRLKPSFEGKSYGTTMAQISARMVGLLGTESIKFMESELTRMGTDDHDATAMGIIMAHMLVKQATKKFGVDWTTKACMKEIKQIHMRKTFVPKHRHELTPKQQERMVEAFIFLTEKRSGEIKARKVLGGNVQCNYISKDEASSPTVYTESVIMTAVIDAKERWDVSTVDIPNTFCQTVITDKDAKHLIIVRLRGPAIDILCEIAPEVYLEYVTTNKEGKKTLLVQCMNALYGSMITLVLFYTRNW